MRALGCSVGVTPGPSLPNGASCLVTRVVLSAHLSRYADRLAGLRKRTDRVLRQPEVTTPPPVLPVRGSPHLSPAQAMEAARRYKAGAQMREVADDLGIHYTTVSHTLHESAVPLRGKGMQDADVAEAADLYQRGWSLGRLGERYGCAHTTVRLRLLEAGVQLRPRPGWKY